MTTAILGAGGYVGQHFARLLSDHPWFELPRLVGGEHSAGSRLDEIWQLAEPVPAPLAGVRVEEGSPARLARAGVQVVFSALPSGSAGMFERELTRRGVAVFSNASDHRREVDVPLLVPEVNLDHLGLLDRRLKGRSPLVTNPNCSATGLALALAPVLGLLDPAEIHVSTYQALSGAGYPGVPSLAIYDNVVPFIPEEEEKLAEETRWILGRVTPSTVRPLAVPILTQTARVPVRDGHLEAVTVKGRARPGRAELLRAWASFAPLRGLDLPTAPEHPVVVRAEVDRPQPLRDRWAGSPDRARGMSVSIGRVRWEAPYLRFFVLSHNAVRGGAGGSVLNAESALTRGYIAR